MDRERQVGEAKARKINVFDSTMRKRFSRKFIIFWLTNMPFYCKHRSTFFGYFLTPLFEKRGPFCAQITVFPIHFIGIHRCFQHSRPFFNREFRRTNMNSVEGCDIPLRFPEYDQLHQVGASGIRKCLTCLLRPIRRDTKGESRGWQELTN